MKRIDESHDSDCTIEEEMEGKTKTLFILLILIQEKVVIIPKCFIMAKYNAHFVNLLECQY